MFYIANAVGVIAVILFVLSYQMKTRQGILLCNIASRVLYVVQYMLLFAFEGALLDILGVLASFIAQKKDSRLIKKYKWVFFIPVDLSIVFVGLLLYRNVYSLFPMFGVLLHTGAFWLNKEKHIRALSFLGSPFWFVYNFVSGAYGSAVGDVMTMVSILLAIFRYDILHKEKRP